MARYIKRPDGRYRYQLYIGTDSSGKKQIQYLYGSTIPELERKIKAARAKLAAGERLDAAEQPFGMWAQRLLDVKEPDLAPV